MSYRPAKNNLLFLIFCLFFTHKIFAELPVSTFGNSIFPKVLSAQEAFSVNVSHTESSIHLAWYIAPQCYLYQESIKIFLIALGKEPLSLLNEANLPAGKKTQDPNFGEQIIYSEPFSLTLDLKDILAKLTDPRYAIKITYQGCAESGFCYPPMDQSLTLFVENHQITALTPVQQAPLPIAPSVKNGSEKNKVFPPTQSFLTTVFTFYFIGVLLTFTPCVLPMIPILFVVIVGQAHLNTRRAFTVSLCYVLSMAITYAIAGVIVATLGKNLQASLQKPLIIVLFSALFAYLGLIQLGIGKISLPAAWRDWLHQSHSKQSSGSYVGAAIMGILATLVASPCVSAPMMGALGYISQSGNVVLGGSALFAMGLGMGTFLIVIGTLEGKYLPQKGPWMNSINQIFAIILFGLSIWLLDRLLPGPVMLTLWGLLLLLAATWAGTFSPHPNRSGRLGALLVAYAGLLFWGSWHGAEDPLKPLFSDPWKIIETRSKIKARFETIHSLSEWDEQLSLAKKEQHPTMLIFHADWCMNCKQFEQDVLMDSEIQKQLSDWTLITADVTHNDEMNQALLKYFDLVGPPVVLFFDKNGNELTEYRIIGGASNENFAEHLHQLKQDLK